ncbi:hypothetical protein FIBSPDRAFT_1005362 [Athelia psychrophila]|uniref:Uncharacterized protein n=1 Tax=Athelia psychrophila TaxID=1759441 RepID=A0A166PIY9_9AGAM|nr:hypothetical protein FIBSPDRAFT_1005362 [Fibularhizoctonia sp. CBS 109695]
MLISATFKLLAVLATASLAAARVCPSCPLEFKLTADYSKFITTLEGPNEPQEDGPCTCLRTQRPRVYAHMTMGPNARTTILGRWRTACSTTPEVARIRWTWTVLTYARNALAQSALAWSPPNIHLGGYYNHFLVRTLQFPGDSTVACRYKNRINCLYDFTGLLIFGTPKANCLG